jgi:hypothetical protein
VSLQSLPKHKPPFKLKLNKTLTLHKLLKTKLLRPQSYSSNKLNKKPKN